MSSIPDFTDIEIWDIQNNVDQRWNKDKIELQLVDVEIKTDDNYPDLTEYPATFRHAQVCSFVITKTAEKTDRRIPTNQKDFKHRLRFPVFNIMQPGLMTK